MRGEGESKQQQDTLALAPTAGRPAGLQAAACALRAHSAPVLAGGAQQQLQVRRAYVFEGPEQAGGLRSHRVAQHARKPQLRSRAVTRGARSLN